jgi:quaternary ammonium compound-resistance protein SugE
VERLTPGHVAPHRDGWTFGEGLVTMPWIWLCGASILEIGWAIGIKFTNGFTVLLPSVLVVAGMIVSFLVMALVVRDIPIGTAYAVFTGIGAGGTGLLGIVLFNEPAGVLRLGSLAAIVCGVIGLKLFSGPSEAEGLTSASTSVQQ